MTALAHRLVTGSDLPFIYGAWLDSWRLAHAAGTIPMDLYSSVYTETIRRLLLRPDCDVVVAHRPDEAPGAADLYGFLCAERTVRGPVVHYVYVREAQRRQGIARGMFEAAAIDLAAPLVYTHRTAVVLRLRGKMPRGRYDPLAARFASAWQEDRPEETGR